MPDDEFQYFKQKEFESDKLFQTYEEAGSSKAQVWPLAVSFMAGAVSALIVVRTIH